MAELVDAYVSGAYFERSAGSSPVSGTRRFFPKLFCFIIEFCKWCFIAICIEIIYSHIYIDKKYFKRFVYIKTIVYLCENYWEKRKYVSS